MKWRHIKRMGERETPVPSATPPPQPSEHSLGFWPGPRTSPPLGMYSGPGALQPFFPTAFALCELPLHPERQLLAWQRIK